MSRFLVCECCNQTYLEEDMSKNNKNMCCCCWCYTRPKDKRIAELEEQLANSIIPKFKMGDYVYSVRKFGKQILLAEGNITSITKLDDGSIHYHLVAEPHNFGVSEDSCYKTMEEAHEVTQKLLEEINNE